MAGYESRQLEGPENSEPAELDGDLGKLPNGTHTPGLSLGQLHPELLLCGGQQGQALQRE